MHGYPAPPPPPPPDNLYIPCIYACAEAIQYACSIHIVSIDGRNGEGGREGGRGSTFSIVATSDGPYGRTKPRHDTHHMCVLPVPAYVTHCPPTIILVDLNATFVLTAWASSVYVRQTNIYIGLGWEGRRKGGRWRGREGEGGREG